MLNEKNIKFIAIDGEDKELIEFLKRKSESVCSINADMFDKHLYAYNSMGTNSIGTLASDPELIISPYHKNGQRRADIDRSELDVKNLTMDEMIESQNWAVQATMSYVSHYWTDSKGKRNANYCYLMLLFTSPKAKKIILNYHKGDSIMVEGRLETLPVANPQDPTSKIHSNYLRVTSFLANGGQSLRKMALSKLLGKKDIDPNEKVKQILAKINDPATSREELVLLANQLSIEKEKANKSHNISMRGYGSESQSEREQTAKTSSNSKKSYSRQNRSSNNQFDDVETENTPREKMISAEDKQQYSEENPAGNAQRSENSEGSNEHFFNIRNRRQKKQASQQNNNTDRQKQHVSKNQLFDRFKSMQENADLTDENQSEDLDPQYSSYYDQWIAKMRNLENADQQEKQNTPQGAEQAEPAPAKMVTRQPELSDLDSQLFTGIADYADRDY